MQELTKNGETRLVNEGSGEFQIILMAELKNRTMITCFIGSR